LATIRRATTFDLIGVIIAVAATSSYISKTMMSLTSKLSPSIPSPLPQSSPSTTSVATLPSPYLWRINYMQQQQQFPSMQRKGNTTRVVKVAFVRPVFTYAAYELNGFYNF
jgi:hypothetical protein